MSKIPDVRNSTYSRIPPPRSRMKNNFDSSNGFAVSCSNKVLDSALSAPNIDESNTKLFSEEASGRDNDYVGRTKSAEYTSAPTNKVRKINHMKGDFKYLKYKQDLNGILPKFSVDCKDDVLAHNPKIIDLRNKLDEINKKKEKDVDKETKTLINDITQQLVDDESDDNGISGPYSLIMELQSGSFSHNPFSEDNMQSKEAIFIPNIFQSSDCASEYKSLECCEKGDIDNISNMTDVPMKIHDEKFKDYQTEKFDVRNRRRLSEPPSTINFRKSTRGDVHSRSRNLKSLQFNNDGFPIAVNKRNLNRLTLEEKTMNEFEYYCEEVNSSENTNVANNSQNANRYDLCLNFKNDFKGSGLLELTSPTTDSSTQRTTEDNSLDDSLGILTPDQMDDMCLLENTFSPTVEGLPVLYADPTINKSTPDNSETPSTDKTDTNSAASTMFMDKENVFNETVEETITNHDISSCKPDSLKRPHCNSSENTLMQTIVEVSDSNDQSMAIQYEVLESTTNESYGDSHLETVNISNITIEDELLPSVHSSILDPVSSVVDTTVNLDLPLDSKHYDIVNNTSIIPRMDQTPSPEELPLDPTDVLSDSTVFNHSQVCSSALLDSQTDSETKTDLIKSVETSKVSSSFITSITSITSLDGYQGDGEMSRPVSRGADQSPSRHREEIIPMEWQNIPVNRRPDPMTDSDFFTESDADGHDEQLNRKAQVIDGALYGGNSNSGIAPVIVNRNDDSCMESSGVYTDLENQRGSPVFLNAIDDLSPGGSTPSTHSECSQRNSAHKDVFFDARKMDGSKSGSKCILNEDSSNKRSDGSRKTSMTPDKDDKFAKNRSILDKSVKDEKRIFALKKYKMPKRDVPSKLKSMLARKPDSPETVSAAVTPNKSVKKVDRRDIVTKKTPPTADNKLKNYKEVKSKVDCCYSLQRSQTTCSVPSILNNKSPLINSKVKTAARTETGCRRRRVDAGLSSKSSVHSSQSDISAASTPILKQPPSRFLAARAAKKREQGAAPAAATPTRPAPVAKKNAAPPASKPSPGAGRARAATPSAGTPRKAPPARRAAAAPPVAASLPPAQLAVAVVPAKGDSGVSPAAAAEARHAARGVEALGVLLQYLVFQLKALESPTWREEATRWRAVAAQAADEAGRASHDHALNMSECAEKIVRLEREVGVRRAEGARLTAERAAAEEQYRATLRDVSRLADDIKALKGTIECLKRDVQESRARLCAPPPCAHDFIDKDKEALAAEIQSLRAVLELKQAETCELRRARELLAAESTRREAAERAAAALGAANEELRARAAARQQEAASLVDRNRRLQESCAREASLKNRLDMYNEELRYKLRQKSQVVNLLAAQGGPYLNHTYPRVRRRSPSPTDSPTDSPADSPEPADSPGPRPAVKGVVEKQDSVSWVLEIEESAEETATRLARRAGSFRSTPGALKRREAGSPPSAPPASPAPAASKLLRCGSAAPLDYPAAALKESAGEAIYIYDNRQY